MSRAKLRECWDLIHKRLNSRFHMHSDFPYIIHDIPTPPSNSGVPISDHTSVNHYHFVSILQRQRPGQWLIIKSGGRRKGYASCGDSFYSHVCCSYLLLIRCIDFLSSIVFQIAQ